MTALEDAIIKPLIDSGVLKFCFRFVDDTLVLAKPSDFPFILNKLNSFHPELQFTIDSFTDDQDIHFLDIKITPNGTSVYRKSTHTGQYVHLSSFTPWYRKTARLRALIHPAYKLCSNSKILSIELSEIYKFASWNGFPKRLTKNLLKQFAFTDRCLQTRIKEHCHSNDSEIYKHINSCDEFNLNSNLLLSLPFNEPSLLIETVMENTVIIDKSKHWSILLYKEAFHIHRQKPILNHGTKASKKLESYLIELR